MYKTIKVKIEDSIAYLTINKPEVLNALDGQVLEEISEAIGEKQGSQSADNNR